MGFNSAFKGLTHSNYGVCECTHGPSGTPRRRNHMITSQVTLGAMVHGRNAISSGGLKTAFKRMVVT